MDYLDYESTLPHVKKTYFDHFKFFSMEKVADQIKSIPEQPYGLRPDGSPADADQAPEPSTGCKMTPHETARMNKVPAAKTLLLGDTRKAQAICDFVKAMFMRDLVPVNDTTTQNCLYEAFLQQISNSDFMYNPESGEAYSPMDLRAQLLYLMATDYEEFYPKVQMHLETSYKKWLYEQMDEASPSDLVAVSALRHMFQVSKKYFIEIFLSTGPQMHK